MTVLLRRLSYLITSRYHASVLSMASGIPITAVSMDERLDNILREMSLDALYLHHVTDPDLAERICTSLKTGEAHREELRLHIAERYAGYLAKLDDMGIFLKEYMNNHLTEELS